MTDLIRFVEGYPTMESGLTFLRVVRHARCPITCIPVLPHKPACYTAQRVRLCTSLAITAAVLGQLATW